MNQMKKDPLIEEFDLNNRVVFITGGGGDICGTLGRRLATAGARIVLADINLECAQRTRDEIVDAGFEAIAVHCDVLDRVSIDTAAKTVIDRWGGIDVLINGAGGNQDSGSADVGFVDESNLDDERQRTFFDLEEAGLRSVIDLNLLGTVLPAQHIGRHMVERARGAIINISSMNAHTPLTRIPAYAAAKSAVSNFTQWLAVHLAHTGVRVNAIAPGFVMTQQLRFLHISRETGEYTDRAKSVIAHTPMGRYADPDELVAAVLFLATDASSFITGTVIPIDGGFSSYSI